MGRSVFVRGIGAAAGLFAASGALGAAARTVAKPQSAPVKAAVKASGPGRFLGSVRTLAKGQAAAFTDPASGDPALLVHLNDGRILAYDAVCTHAGCTVEFDAKKQLLTCPCHGATYDPAHGAKVIAGPTKAALAPLAIRVDAAQNVYALDAAANGSTANQLTQAKSYSGQTGDDAGAGGKSGGDGGGSSRNSGGDDGAVRASRRPASAKRRVVRRQASDD
jgi:Rieske Fe-S protein